jgi:CIC family chloride channel protein
MLVGCGAAAAIATAFNAPLAGAFYAFELIIGGYTPASLTPIGVAAVTGYFVTHGFGALSLGIRVCTIAPGLFDTPLLAGLPEAARARHRLP